LGGIEIEGLRNEKNLVGRNRRVVERHYLLAPQLCHPLLAHQILRIVDDYRYSRIALGSLIGFACVDCIV
jgi:hypothetical protein